MAVASTQRMRWSEEETLLALYLYFQLPFGKLHSGNPEIQQLAKALNRSSSSIAMKLCNFASLDPKITGSGRRGLEGASKLDRETYAQFGHNWAALVARAELLWTSQIENGMLKQDVTSLKEERSEFRFGTYRGSSSVPVLINQRVGQSFFRRAVLANYEEACCVTGIADPRLLNASHIRPWGQDSENRHNPANGLLLSATLDRAFDRGLITVDSERCVLVCRELRESPSVQTREYFEKFERARLRSAIRFDPDPTFLAWHRDEHFVDHRSN